MFLEGALPLVLLSPLGRSTGKPPCLRAPPIMIYTYLGVEFGAWKQIQYPLVSCWEIATYELFSWVALAKATCLHKALLGQCGHS